MRGITIRLYAYFALIALTVAVPPLVIFTGPLFYLVWHNGRQATKAEEAQRRRKALEKRERERLSALRSLP